MRIVLDYMIPHRLRHHIEGDVFTARYMGWEALPNGELLKACEERDFDVLLTNDQGIRHQQNLERSQVAVVQLDAPSNDANDLLRLVPKINEVLSALSPGDFVTVG